MKIRVDYEYGNIKFSHEGIVKFVDGDEIYYEFGGQLFAINKNAKNYELINGD